MTIEKYKTSALQEMDKTRRNNSTSPTGVLFRHGGSTKAMQGILAH